MRRVLLQLAVAGGVVISTAVPLTAAGAARNLEHVTFIGDSVASAISDVAPARQVMGRGIDLDLEVAPCRRLEAQSCPPRPPTALELINQLGSRVGPVVVLAVGYNDPEDLYAAELADVLDALDALDVKHVFVLTLRAVRHPYLTMNDAIRAEAAKRADVSVIDWNLYSRSHPEWFQDDELHLDWDGAIAMATLVNKQLLAAGVAVPPPRVATSSLPAGVGGRSYTARLRAVGGSTPYRWSLIGRLPLGLHLRSSGVLAGTPRRVDVTGVYTFVVRVVDADGQTGTRKLLLRLRRS
jgi:Putative Ig domain